MKKLPIIALIAALAVGCAPKDNVYQFTVTDNKGNEVCLDQYKGQVVLIVNTATQCGFTPQYSELDELYDTYKEQGFTILDFPCNQFGAQAPGTDEEIEDFCVLRFGTTFPRFHKIDVNGEQEIPLYTYLKSKCPFQSFDMEHPLGALLDNMFRSANPEYDQNSDIKWNFTKFLVNRKGEVVERFEPTATKEVLAPAIEALL